MTDVDWRELLGRSSAMEVVDPPASLHRDQCVFISGADGSIGSALTMRLAELQPRLLLLLDAYEQNLYELDARLKRHVSRVPYVAVLGSICDDGLRRTVCAIPSGDVVPHRPVQTCSPDGIQSACSGLQQYARHISPGSRSGVESHPSHADGLDGQSCASHEYHGRVEAHGGAGLARMRDCFYAHDLRSSWQRSWFAGQRGRSFSRSDCSGGLLFVNSAEKLCACDPEHGHALRRRIRMRTLPYTERRVDW